MAQLQLIRLRKEVYALAGVGDPCDDDDTRNLEPRADFTLFDINGGDGDPFAHAATSWEVVDGVEGIEYDEDDYDSFLAAIDKVEKAAENSGLSILGS